MKQDKYFIYYFNNGVWNYERTCGSQEAALARVEELKQHYEKAMYMKNKVMKEAFV